MHQIPKLKCFSSHLATCHCPIHWSQVLRREWRCNWSIACRRCSKSSEWSRIVLPIKVRIILEVWWYIHWIMLICCCGKITRYLHRVLFMSIDQSHRYGRHQAACREPAGSYDNTTRTAICFEHKTQYLLIRAPYTRIVVFWHISNIPPMNSQSQISCNTPTLYIAAIFVRNCYTTGSWLL